MFNLKQEIVPRVFIDIEPPFMPKTNWFSMGEMVVWWLVVIGIFIVFVFIFILLLKRFFPPFVRCRKIKQWQQRLQDLPKNQSLKRKLSMEVYLQIKSWSMEESKINIWMQWSFSNEDILLENVAKELRYLRSTCKLWSYWKRK